MLQDLLTSTAAVPEYSVCGTPVTSKVQKYVQTVLRRIKLTRAGCLFQTFTSTVDIIRAVLNGPNFSSKLKKIGAKKCEA